MILIEIAKDIIFLPDKNLSYGQKETLANPSLTDWKGCWMGCLHACAHDAAMCVRRGGRPRREKEEGKEGYIEWRMEKRALEEEKGKRPFLLPSPPLYTNLIRKSLLDQ